MVKGSKYSGLRLVNNFEWKMPHAAVDEIILGKFCMREKEISRSAIVCNKAMQ